MTPTELRELAIRADAAASGHDQSGHASSVGAVLRECASALRAAATPSAQGADPALAQLDSADARSTVARALCCPDGCQYPDRCCAQSVQRLAHNGKQIDAILSTGLLPDASPGAEKWSDTKIAGWARNWHWQDCAEDKRDPSIYFRDMRMLKAFIAALHSTSAAGEMNVFVRMADDGGMPKIDPDIQEPVNFRTASEIEAERREIDIITGAQMDAIESAAIAGKPLAELPEDTVEDKLREALEALAEEIEGLYHRADREFNLPNVPASYAANMPEGQRWSCPYSPVEISDYVRSRIDGIVTGKG